MAEVSDDIKLTTGPLDLFKIINEIFENYKRCRQPEVARSMITITKRMIFYYQNHLNILLVSSSPYMPLI